MNRHRTFVLVLCFLANARAQDLAYRCEAGGNFSFSTFDRNTQLRTEEYIGYNVSRFYNICISGEQYYRNHSLSNAGFVGNEFRYGIAALQIPIAVSAGLEDLRIGSFHQLTPVLGIGSGMYFTIVPQVSLRANYKLLRYFDEVGVWGNDVTLGLCVSFWPRRNHAQQP